MAEDDFLRKVPLFVEFDAAELDHLRRALHKSHFAPGDVILQEGNANRALHIVRSGRIRVTRTVHEHDVPLCELVEGQTFGELSIIEDGVASASLRAVTDTEVLSVSMNDLADFLRHNPPRRRQVLARDRRRPPPPPPPDQRRRPQLFRSEPRADRESDVSRGVCDV